MKKKYTGSDGSSCSTSGSLLQLKDLRGFDGRGMFFRFRADSSGAPGGAGGQKPKDGGGGGGGGGRGAAGVAGFEDRLDRTGSAGDGLGVEIGGPPGT